ncbi:MAG: hypothetical protein NT067_02385 [Candidatus Diapherotrites archaeon]|nr:hypothetical protein [Candidatus Diapherotrites archaeon]
MAKIIIVAGTHPDEVTSIFYAGLIAKKLKAAGHEVRFAPIRRPLPKGQTLAGWARTELPLYEPTKRNFLDLDREEIERNIAETNPGWFVFRFHNSPANVFEGIKPDEIDKRERIATNQHSASQGDIVGFDRKSKATFLYPTVEGDLPNLFTVEIPAVYKRNARERIEMTDFGLSRKAGFTDERILAGVTKTISRIVSGRKMEVIVPSRHPKVRGTVLAKRKRAFRV